MVLAKATAEWERKQVLECTLGEITHCKFALFCLFVFFVFAFMEDFFIAICRGLFSKLLPKALNLVKYLMNVPLFQECRRTSERKSNQ